ncbi:MAG: leucine--tRNA ligase, partial [Bdellovibrio sp.]
QFAVAGPPSGHPPGHPPLEVFTTRPDTLFGVTFMVLAPEHPLVAAITTPSQKKPVTDYVRRTLAKSEVDRKAALDKTGVFTGAHALHPLTGAQLPIWISDYVLMDYGSGAIMAVPGHDDRDFTFATQFSLPIVRVVEGGDLPFTNDGKLVASEFLNGLGKSEAISRMIQELERRGLGARHVQYKLRDWLFSRQRYWGEPFPMVHMSDGSLKAVPLDELPVTLPPVADYEPSEKGEPPLARAVDWVNYKNMGWRETDTMPGSAGSSWYFLRYTDSHNESEPFAFSAQKYWLPVDLYVGGPEHTVGHLLYARFWQKVLFDAGLVSHDEPFQKLIHQGMVLGSDGEKMSKSRGNTVDPDEVREQQGADALRLYLCFMGPTDKDKPWATKNIEGVRRFLERFWRLVVDDSGKVMATDGTVPGELQKLLHRTIKKVTEDIECMSFNTAVSAMMILVNEMYRLNARPREVLKTLAQLLAPLGPHLAEEVWELLGGSGFVSLATWPTYDPALIAEDTVTVAVQVNGKTRGTISLAPQAGEPAALEAALALHPVRQALGEKSPQKVIYKAGKIINLISS